MRCVRIVAGRIGQGKPIKDYDKYQSKVNTAEKSISAQRLYTVKVLVRGVAIAVLLAMFIGLVVYMLTRLVFY